jgi:hypothetical protein
MAGNIIIGLTAGDLNDALHALAPDSGTPIVVRGKGPQIYAVKMETTEEFDDSLPNKVRRTEQLVIIAEG